jgi:hypothetical protein
VAAVTGLDCGVALVAAVGLMGAGLLALAWRVRTLLRRIHGLTRDATAEAAWAENAGPALAAERRADEAVGRVDDLAEVHAALGAILDRAEAARDRLRAAA